MIISSPEAAKPYAAVSPINTQTGETMSASTDWRDIKYRETLGQELLGLKRRREYDPACTIEALKGTLTHLYIMDGADWGGRGEVQDIILAATIAAYERTIAEWDAPPDNCTC
ncbi:hypothetical protein FACS1894130_08560 [Spirochaetia bacterium]|nr:hypothetical protein FACS1894130_08560 [Spirochaetia bacterium]